MKGKNTILLIILAIAGMSSSTVQGEWKRVRLSTEAIFKELAVKDDNTVWAIQKDTNFLYELKREETTAYDFKVSTYPLTQKLHKVYARHPRPDIFGIRDNRVLHPPHGRDWEQTFLKQKWQFISFAPIPLAGGQAGDVHWAIGNNRIPYYLWWDGGWKFKKVDAVDNEHKTVKFTKFTRNGKLIMGISTDKLPYLKEEFNINDNRTWIVCKDAKKVEDIAIGKYIWAVGEKGKPFILTIAAGKAEWKETPVEGNAVLTRIATSPQGYAYALSTAGALYRWDRSTVANATNTGHLRADEKRNKWDLFK